MDFDVMVCTDCWWNLPRVISHRILASDIKHKILCSTYDEASKPIRQNLAHLESQTDFKQFMEKYVGLAKQQQRPARVLIAGQGWGCGTHQETIGLRTLSAFVPQWVRVFVDTEMLALVTQELDRTCTGEHVMADDEFEWQRVEGTVYEMKGVKKLKPINEASHFSITKKPKSQVDL